MKKIISILGSTGSVGINTLDVISKFPEDFAIYGLSCRENIGLLIRQIEKFNPHSVAILNEEKAIEVKKLLKGKKVEIYSGMSGLIKIAEAKEVNMVVGALTGKNSLFPLLRAIGKGKDIAVANKEVIVGFGKILVNEAKKKKVRILPVDSEISAIFQCLEGRNIDEVKEVILTASGGPFYRLSRMALEKVTRQEAIKHPIWKMGKKISVDSATLMNKGLEIIEASNFFGIPLSKIRVLIHPQTIIHSVVSFIDGISLAQLAIPDMRIPIQYVLFYPKRIGTFLPSADLAKAGNLEFIHPDTKSFPCLQYAREAVVIGKGMPAVLSAADEVGVNAFLEGKIGFMDIPRVIKRVMDKYKRKCQTLKELLEADEWARDETEKIICSGRVNSA
ncbi:1-deoxy-D-xylulose-5-phosphate reductoisomerase [Candidatus Desantisbacteria bacterium CG1_02_38_46]|uniref:1-deoxy-D-xylulose 5-phosphate reductoisomerase n=2 Tax=unclassified Candidatus Desantisiibacteriota TaxID=3106372 RepID=A0A1J4SAJ5_9BACT|nr:MAG: 1-deoxy-D-xylulose-5-phosphate reductoisomerase [Candidatus Desantisbacteria bacterium CG1_02_38_46]PIU51960.1 MAG: 1-deoxy-D-xylulose-5-phosphate reductoisomerase [Candidatus Desantisbacteria bacterium CG07_land_8_20_14_0_80_39_15]